MPDVTLHTDLPEGTVLGAYKRAQLVDGQRVPVGTPVATGTVHLRNVTFSNLAKDINYIAYAEVNGIPRLLRFSTALARRDVFVDELGTLIDPDGNALAGAGQPGQPGPPGPPGQDAITSSDALRGAADRYYRLVAGAVEYTGSGWELVNDAFSRPQNVDSVASTANEIRIHHETIGALHVAGFVPVFGENLTAVGIRPVTKPGVEFTDITFRQDRTLSDHVHWDGSKWVLAKGALSPFQLSGLDGGSADYPATVLAETGVQGYWRFSEASGAVIQDETVNNRDGAVVSTGTTYGITTGAPVVSDPTPDKAMKVATGGTNEFTLPTTGISQAAFTVELWIKVAAGSTVVIRDNTTSNVSGYWLAKNLTTGVIQYRMGTSTIYQTAYPWASLEDTYRHIVWIKNGAAVKLYIDGVLVHSGTGAPTTAIASPWHLGRSGHGATAVVSQAAEVSEASNYNVELSAATIRAHYYAGVADGVLRVTHPDVGDVGPGGISLTPQGSAVRPVLGDVITGTSFGVKFYDSTNTLMLTPATSQKASIQRSVSERKVNPSSFTAIVNVSGDDYDAAVEADAPRDYWTLGDTVGAVTAEPEIGTSSGAIGSGVTMGVAGLLSADPHTAAQFDGTANGKIVFPSPALINAPFSLEMWFKRTGAGTIGQTNFSAICGWTSNVGTRWVLLKDDGSFLIAIGGASLTTPASTCLDNVVYHMAITWDLLRERFYINGVEVAAANTASVSLNAPLILGAHINPSTNYGFKGTIGRPAVYTKALTPNQVQQHYATGSGVVLIVDRAVGSRITFQGVLETGPPPVLPPPEQPLPTPTPLDNGDLGGAVTANLELSAYRSVLGTAGSWIKRALPTDVPGRNAILLNGYTLGANSYPAATSLNWRNSLCDLFGIDENTPQDQAVPNTTTPSPVVGTPLWLAPSLRMYIVPDDQPLRPFVDQDVTVSGWAAEINAIVNKLGGYPLPGDARPDPSADRYAYFFQPSKDRMINIYDFHGSTPATTTMQLTGSPSAGAFGVKFFYRDNALSATTTYFLQTLIPYNATAAQVKAAIDGAKTASGSVFGNFGTRPGSYYGSCVVLGGPLNLAPITVNFPSVDPLQPVAFVITDFFLNAGTVTFDYTNSGPYDRGRLSAITTPSLDGAIPTGVSGWTGSYSNKFDSLGFRWMDSRWGPTATGIDQSVLIPSWEEYQNALDNGTGVGHVIALRIGNCMGSPFNHVYPAIRGDGALIRADASMITEGALIAFPPDVDLSGVIPAFLPIARTIRDHGAVIYDKTGQGAEIVFRANGFADSGIPNIWLDLLPLYKTAGDAPARYMRSLPWHKAQIIDPVKVQSGW